MGLIKPEHHDAFISYASRDNVAFGELVRGVRDDLAQKFTARFASGPNAVAEFFIDQTGMPANGLPSEDLKEEVIAAEYLVIFMSDRYLESEFCGKELDWFRERFGGDRSAALQRTFIIVLERRSLTRNWKSFLEEPERPKFVQLFDAEGEPLRRYLQASGYKAVLNPAYETKIDWIVKTMIEREQKEKTDVQLKRGVRTKFKLSKLNQGKYEKFLRHLQSVRTIVSDENFKALEKRVLNEWYEREISQQ
jgi:hypothetical protein